MNIGDVFLALRADGARFQAEAIKEAQKAGDAAGATLGSRMGKAAGVALRGGLAVLSAGAAIATKGLIELDNTMAQFTADTGLAGEAADAAKKSILAMSGRNLQPMKEIGTVLGKVHTDLGLTGEAAEETAERFLQFARVTKRDASEEVAAFDDILDAWGLTADDSAGLMDQLIASHQEFGGSIVDDEAALKALAPAMKALNFDIDDSIGLLNLFKSKGLDASSAQRAFNTAVKNLPPGTNLEDILEKIQAIEDPSLRAAAATEIFGTKGGNALANALQPGIGSLEDFKITTEEADGAMVSARDAIDGTFGNWAQLQLKGFTTKLTELGAGFGPVLTGLVSLGSLAGSLGFKGLGSKLSSGIAGAWKTVLSSTLVSGAIAKVASLASTLYLRALMFGDAISGALSKAWGKVASSKLVSNAVARASALAATGYLKALIIGDAVGNALSTAWGKTGGAALKAAGTAGSKAGMAFKVAFIAAAIFLWKEVLDTFNDQKAGITAMAEEIGKDVANQITGGTTEGLEQSRDALEAGIKKLLGTPGAILSVDAINLMDAQLVAINAELERRAAEAAGAVGDGLAAGAPTVAAGAATMIDPAIKAFTDLGYSADQAKELVGADAQVISGEVVGAFELMAPTITDGAEVWEKYRTDVAAEQQQAITDQLDFTSKALSDLVGFQSSVEDALSGVYNAEHDATVTKNRIIILEDQLTAAREEHRKKGKNISAAEKADYENRRIEIEGELQDLKLHAVLIGDDMHRVTALTALLTAKDLKAGLTSENDNIRTASQVQRDKIIGYLKDIETQGGPAAKQATAILAQWMNPTNPLSPLYGVEGEVQETGQDYIGNLSGAVKAGTPNFAGKIENLQNLLDPQSGTLANAGTWGGKTGVAYISGVSAGVQGGMVAFAGKLAAMEKMMKAGSPPGPGAALYGIDKWGLATGEAYVNPFTEALARLPDMIRRSLAKVGDSLAQPFEPSPIAFAGAGALSRSAIPSMPLQAMGGVVGSSGGSVTNVNVQVPGLLKAETPTDVVRSLRHLNVYGTFGEERK